MRARRPSIVVSPSVHEFMSHPDTREHAELVLAGGDSDDSATDLDDDGSDEDDDHDDDVQQQDVQHGGQVAVGSPKRRTASVGSDTSSVAARHTAHTTEEWESWREFNFGKTPGSFESVSARPAPAPYSFKSTEQPLGAPPQHVFGIADTLYELLATRCASSTVETQTQHVTPRMLDKADLSPCRIQVPETLIYHNGIIVAWYTTDTFGRVIQRDYADMSHATMAELFVQGQQLDHTLPTPVTWDTTKNLDVRAVFFAQPRPISADEVEDVLHSPEKRSSQGVSTTFLSAKEIASFRPKGHGVLQLFVLPRGKYNDVFQVRWDLSGKFRVQHRVSHHALINMHVPVRDRCRTFEPVEKGAGRKSFKTSKVTEEHTLAQLRPLLRRIVRHAVCAARPSKMMLTKLVVYFKRDMQGQWWLLWCDQMRFENIAVTLPFDSRHPRAQRIVRLTSILTRAPMSLAAADTQQSSSPPPPPPPPKGARSRERRLSIVPDAVLMYGEDEATVEPAKPVPLHGIRRHEGLLSKVSMRNLHNLIAKETEANTAYLESRGLLAFDHRMQTRDIVSGAMHGNKGSLRFTGVPHPQQMEILEHTFQDLTDEIDQLIVRDPPVWEQQQRVTTSGKPRPSLPRTSVIQCPSCHAEVPPGRERAHVMMKTLIYNYEMAQSASSRPLHEALLSTAEIYIPIARLVHSSDSADMAAPSAGTPMSPPEPASPPSENFARGQGHSKRYDFLIKSAITNDFEFLIRLRLAESQAWAAFYNLVDILQLHSDLVEISQEHSFHLPPFPHLSPSRLYQMASARAAVAEEVEEEVPAPHALSPQPDSPATAARMRKNSVVAISEHPFASGALSASPRTSPRPTKSKRATVTASGSAKSGRRSVRQRLIQLRKQYAVGPSKARRILEDVRADLEVYFQKVVEHPLLWHRLSRFFNLRDFVRRMRQQQSDGGVDDIDRVLSQQMEERRLKQVNELSDAFSSVIPPSVLTLHPHMTEAEYAKLRADPKFLSKTVRICMPCSHQMFSSHAGRVHDAQVPPKLARALQQPPRPKRKLKRPGRIKGMPARPKTSKRAVAASTRSQPVLPSYSRAARPMSARVARAHQPSQLQFSTADRTLPIMPKWNEAPELPSRARPSTASASRPEPRKQTPAVSEYSRANADLLKRLHTWRVAGEELSQQLHNDTEPSPFWARTVVRVASLADKSLDTVRGARVVKPAGKAAASKKKTTKKRANKKKKKTRNRPKPKQSRKP